MPDGGLVPSWGHAAPSPALAPPGAPAPYLGPVPPPSTLLGRALIVACAVMAALGVARSLAYLMRASIDQALVDRVSVPRGDLESSSSLVAALSLAAMAGVFATVGLEVAWRRRRRPKEVLQAYGEAYVEAPLRQAVPIGVRLALGLAGGASVLAFFQGATTRSMTAAQLVSARRWSATAAALLAVTWILLAVFVLTADRHLRRRLEWSGEARAHPGAVPFFPPQREVGEQTGTPAGLGWVLSTAGLVVLVLVGGLMGIGSVAAIVTGQLAGLPWLAVSAAVLALPVWVFRRRWRRRAEQRIEAGRAPDPQGLGDWWAAARGE
ncbi:MAG: hypothetical protein U0Q07_11140 [Acidimicrobiales bacterium]